MKKLVIAITLTVLTGCFLFVAFSDAVQGKTAQELQAQIADLEARLEALRAQLARIQQEALATDIPAACKGLSFERNLKIGAAGRDVKCLQALLNTDSDTSLAGEGPGSSGNETSYLGPLTERAVIIFQQKYAAEVLAPFNLTKGTGLVGRTTRAKLNKILTERSLQWIGNQKKLYEMSTAQIDSILKELQLRFPQKLERLKALAILREGTPYQLGPLGEESGRDKDPIFRIDVTDCTAFVLTNIALLHSQTVSQAREMMRLLNYQPNSEISFENRLHFTINRNAVSPYFKDITEKIGGTKTQGKTIILNKKRADGTRLLDIDWQKETTLKYIPNEYLSRELLQDLPPAAGIAFFREGDEEIGLDVRHEGFLFDGEVLFHASSGQRKVVAEDFFEYYFDKDDNPRFDGIILFEVK